MAFAVDDILRVVHTWTWGTDSVAQIVWHYRCSSASSETAANVLTTIRTAIQTAWTNIDNYITDDLVGTLFELLQWDFTNNRWDGIATLVPTAMDGLNSADYEAHGNAVLCKIRTARNRRQARKFIPGLAEGNITAGFVDGAVLADFVLFAAAFDAVISPATGQFTFCTFNTNPQSPLFETWSDAVQAVTCEATGSYQRRRKPGVGLT